MTETTIILTLLVVLILGLVALIVGACVRLKLNKQAMHMDASAENSNVVPESPTADL